MAGHRRSWLILREEIESRLEEGLSLHLHQQDAKVVDAIR